MGNALNLEQISSGTIDVWLCVKCHHMLGTVTSDWVLCTHRGSTFGGSGNQFRTCPNCGELNVTQPLDKRMEPKI